MTTQSYDTNHLLLPSTQTQETKGMLSDLFAQLGALMDTPKETTQASDMMRPSRSRIFSESVVIQPQNPRNFPKQKEICVDFIDQSLQDSSSIKANKEGDHALLNVNVKPFKPNSMQDCASSLMSYHCDLTQADSDETNDDDCTSFSDDNVSQFSFQSIQTNFKQKEKTEICKNWLANQCRFGSNCSFAHGYDQIQKKSHCNDKYKLTRCKGFHEQGYCPYGARCQFAHVSREHIDSWGHALEQNTLQFKARTETVKQPNMYAEFNVCAGEGFKRLSVFEKLICADSNGKKSNSQENARVSKMRQTQKKRNIGGKTQKVNK